MSGMAQAAHGWGCVAGAATVGAFWASGWIAVALAFVGLFFWAVGFFGARIYDKRVAG